MMNYFTSKQILFNFFLTLFYFFDICCFFFYLKSISENLLYQFKARVAFSKMTPFLFSKTWIELLIIPFWLYYELFSSPNHFPIWISYFNLFQRAQNLSWNLQIRAYKLVVFRHKIYTIRIIFSILANFIHSGCQKMKYKKKVKRQTNFFELRNYFF